MTNEQIVSASGLCNYESAIESALFDALSSEMGVEDAELRLRITWAIDTLAEARAKADSAITCLNRELTLLAIREENRQ